MESVFESNLEERLMKKEFTVGEMISVLLKLDKDLPIYDHFYDSDVEAECWFNLSKPKPRKKTIYLYARKIGKETMCEWSEVKTGEKILETKKVVLLYPPDNTAIEIG